MFPKILIANRGEIACRIIRTARRMGIATVAIHSDADADALHVRMADEHVAIGPAPAAESYLRIDRIVAACRATGAEAVHPGYGFLSEQPAFARALAEAGIAFIGPDAAAMEAMGDKIESRKLAAAAGVNIVPGHPDAIADVEAAVRVAREIGYPVIIKASAGGGGKGMRVAADEAAVRSGLVSARNEARASFADDRVFIEKYIATPRHIEIQVLADGQGTTLWLGERECSIQRRHQKVIEEAPSPLLDAATRQRMGEQAVALARAVQYRSAGTVEFIVDAAKNFYFLEMNTRLQVEHPVTELVTGLDVVELMIRIAAGERLTLAQDDIRLHGCAIETRIYAEDPQRDFAPSPGRITAYHEPAEGAQVRVDSGAFAGGEIPVFYDPMIAKLCTWAPMRDAAIAAMRDALDAFHIRGITHNIPFLASIMRNPRFGEGRLSTAFIAEEYPGGFRESDLRPHDLPLFATVAATVYARQVRREALRTSEEVVVVLDGAQHPARIGPGSRVEFAGSACVVATAWQPGEPLLRGTVRGQTVCVQVDRAGLGWRLSHAGTAVVAKVLPPHVAECARFMQARRLQHRAGALRSPLAGRLVALAATAGQEVTAGAVLAVIEAMKMETTVAAPQDGVVARVLVQPGAMLTADQVLLEFA